MEKIGSNASIFEKRGNPWMSEKDQDGTRLHRREAMTAFEAKAARITGKAALTPILTHKPDPDMDRWTKAGFVQPRFEVTPDKPLSLKPDIGSQRRRIVNITRKMHQRLKGKVVDVKDSTTVLALQAKARARNEAEDEIRIKKSVSGYSIFIRYADGREEERDRATKKQADLLFARMRKRGVDVLEIWSYVTGEMLASWERQQPSK